MTFLIQNEVENEFLTAAEVENLTGAKLLKNQVEYLKTNHWEFGVSKKNEVIISRWYMRIKMSGINIAQNMNVSGGDQLPKFDKVS